MDNPPRASSPSGRLITVQHWSSARSRDWHAMCSFAWGRVPAGPAGLLGRGQPITAPLDPLGGSSRFNRVGCFLVRAARSAKGSRGSGVESWAEQVFYFAGIGEAPHLVLREDQVTVHADFKGSARTLDEAGRNLVSLLNRVRQTGGSGLVVSNNAVFDRDLGHLNFPPRGSIAACDKMRRPGRSGEEKWR